MSLLTSLCILALSIGSVVTSFHLAWTNRRVLRLEARVHELEMERIDLYLMEGEDRRGTEPPPSP